MDGMSGGDKLMEHLHSIAKGLSSGDDLKVGFLEGAKYPDGTPVALVAATNEFGGTVKIPAHTRDLNFYVRRDGVSRFAKPSKANFAQSVMIPEHLVTIPSRPYFRKTISEHGPEWGGELGKLMKANDFDARKSLALMGERIKGQIQSSIIAFSEPPNAKSTVDQKGFDDPLIWSGHMLNSVDYEVKE
ncbi:hypothetical protein REW29_003772 [Klebsiella quasipneumoniae]|nr:hypothetical protein [Klebsiella quasipneumoniae]EKZ5477578.1 hypothetical protein [Klebsiella quasipneumoniae]EKZ5642312.1 hypothetical protein [Klebsiella quasipneumoniae]